MDISKATPRPWGAFNMVDADGKAMSADDIALYIKNSVLKSIENGGSADRFLFIGQSDGDGPDICHVGNGPRGPANAALIVTAVNSYEPMLDALKSIRDDLAAASALTGVPLKALGAANAAIAIAEGKQS